MSRKSFEERMAAYEARARKDELRARKDEQRAYLAACRAEDRAARDLARALAFFRKYPTNANGGMRLAQAYNARVYAVQVCDSLFPRSEAD